MTRESLLRALGLAGLALVVAGGLGTFAFPAPWPLLAVLLGAALLAPGLFARPGGERTQSAQRDARVAMGVEALEAEVERYKQLERELTAAKQAAEAATMAKGEFLATMSHEIRTPLNGIIPLLDILLSTRLGPDQRDYVQTAYQSARQLLRIVDDILDYSKLEANKLDLETVGLNLRELLDGVMRLMERPAEAKGLKLSLSIEPGVRLAVRGDPVRLRQVLTNLVSNAVKFTERGSISVKVSRKGETRDRHLLHFEVADTGIGMPAGTAARLFRPFTQADASTTRTFGGTGLGLVICKRIIDLMEGRIGVDSEPGRGSRFWFEVPLLKAVGDIGTRRHELNGARALLLTSDQAMHRRFALMLPNWGVTQVHAPTTQEALAKLRAAAARSETWAFHLLIADLGTMRSTAVALHRNLMRDSALENLYVVWLESDEAAPAELNEHPRALFVPRTTPDTELRQQVARMLEGGGSAGETRTFVEPAAGAVQAAAAPAPQPAAGAPAKAGGGTLAGAVLLVEDNPVNRQVAQRLLSLLGLVPDLAENGQEALDRLDARRYDLVLMDCQMPVMDGYTATRRLRQREAGGSRTPIVAMTANAMVGDREKCLAAGMDDYLSKPLNRALLEETLRRWLPDPGLAGDAAVAGGPAAAAPREGASTPSPASSSAGSTPAAAPAASPRAASAPRAPAPAAAAAATSPPPDVLQHEVVEDLREIMGAEFDALVRVFLEDAPRAVDKLVAAADAGDVDALVGPAHSLKSTSANLGALRLSELARTIEHGARRGDLADPKSTVARLREEFGHAARALGGLIA